MKGDEGSAVVRAAAFAGDADVVSSHAALSVGSYRRSARGVAVFG
jgi:hypothetical protein